MSQKKWEKEKNESLTAEDDMDNMSLNLLEPDSILKSPQRFNIMFLLYNYDNLGFGILQKVLKITPGNLDHHIKKLITVGWVKDKIHFSPRPLKIYEITEEGKLEFMDEIKKMKEILDNLE